MPSPSRPLPSRSITQPKGFKAAAGAYGIKPSGKTDMVLIAADGPCSAAGVFTQNTCVGAPVTVSKQHLATSGTAQAVVINAGCSNVMTGQQGLADAKAMCQQVADGLGCPVESVLVASTGVIGQMLPMAKVQRGIAELLPNLAEGEQADQIAAKGILTTDLVAKASLETIALGGQTVTIAGIAKGSGMIQPNMATMLGFVTTDATIAPAALQQALSTAARASFNRISVDHDTSTSDMVLALASGQAGAASIETDGEGWAAFTQALTRVCQHLAEQIVCDGEGATRVFDVVIENAQSEADADRVGYTITGSPLVKTAVHGGDPNWGRLLAAAGRSGADVRPEQTSLWIGDQCVLNQGEPAKLTDAEQATLNQTMQAERIVFRMDLGHTQANTPTITWQGCDLSRDYVGINADYTT